MAFYDGEKLRVTSAAAGPVFEAGGISCGTAFYPKENIKSPEDLLKAADAQMYEEKERHHAELGFKK